MKKIFKGLGLGLVSTGLALGMSAGVALATITVSNLAVDSAAGDAMTIGASNVGGTIAIGVANTGGISIGAGNTAKTINIGTGTAVDTINIGTGGTGVDVITLGSSTSPVTFGGAPIGTPSVYSTTSAGGGTNLKLQYKQITNALTGDYEGLQVRNSTDVGSAANAVTGAQIKAVANDVASQLTVATLRGVYTSVDSKDNLVTTARAFEASLDGMAGSTITEAVGIELMNNSSGTQTNSYGLSINGGTASGHKAYTADIRLQNGETISNATDGTISIGAANLTFTGNFTGKNINIVPASIGTAGVKFFTAGLSTAILDVGAQTDRVYGFGTHLTTNFAGADTWVKGLDARIVVTAGTTGNVQGVYSSVSKSGGVAPAQELWGASNAVSVTGGSVANTYGTVGEVTLGASATAGVASGTDGSTPNYITAVLARSVVASAATLSDDSIEAPVIALVANDLAARKKATAAVVAILGGDTASNTAGAAFKAMDFSSTGGYDFDYGLDFGAGVGGSTGPIGGQFGVTGNTFTQADIRLMNGETIDNKTDGGVKVSGWVRPYIESTAPDAVDPTGPVEGALAVDGGEQDCFAVGDGTDGGSLCVYTGAAWVVVKTW